MRRLVVRRPDLSDYRNLSLAYRITLKSLGHRYLELHDKIADLDVMIAARVDELAPDLISRNSIGYASASQLLLTAGDNNSRPQSEASFAALSGVSPFRRLQERVTRHRLNLGGDRAANSALYITAISRLRTDARTKAYVSKRVSEGHSKLEAIRRLKRYIAREVYYVIAHRAATRPCKTQPELLYVVKRQGHSQMDRSSAEAVLAQLPDAFTHFIEVHPHSALKLKLPRMFHRKLARQTRENDLN